MQEVLEAKKGIKPIETQIVEYSATAAGLADLQHRFKDVVFDVATTKGMADAKAARYELVKLRTGLEAKRKEIKAPALERSRLIDAEANKINAAIAELEIPFDQQITAEEERKKAEKKAKEDAEAARIADIRGTISSMAAVAVRAVGRPSAEVQAKIQLVVALVTDEKKADFAEFFDEALAVQADTLAKLRELHAAALKAEADAAELEQLRAADALRRREQEARDQAERKRAADERRAEEARLAEGRRQLEEQQRAQAEEQRRLDREAAERRRKADQEAAEARAEEDRKAREIRVAEERRLDEQRAKLRREQDERDRLEREEHMRESQRLLEAAQAAERAKAKLEGAAKQLLDALIGWQTIDRSKVTRGTDAWKQTARTGDDAIAAATGADT